MDEKEEIAKIKKLLMERIESVGRVIEIESDKLWDEVLGIKRRRPLWEWIKKMF